MILRRGATVDHKFNTPIDLTGATIYITYVQNDKVILEKTGGQLKVEADCVTVPLSQEDTLSFDQHGGDVRIQLRYVFESGIADASQIITVSVGALLKEGAIEWTSM